MNSLRYIKYLIYKYRFRYLAGILSLILVDTLQLITPLVLGNITNCLKASTLTNRQ